MGDTSSPPGMMPTSGPFRAYLPSEDPTASYWQTSYPNSRTHHRSTPDLPPQADIVVIGTGMSGTFATDELVSQLQTSESSRQKPITILVLEARTLCSAATGRNGGHLLPIVHGTKEDVLAFEMANFQHVSSLINSRNIECEYRRLSSCLGFWNQTYFQEAKDALAAMSADVNQLVKVVEGAEGLKQLGLMGGPKGALVQSVAASLSPYKLCVSMWERLLKRYQDSSKHGFNVNLQTTTPVISLGANSHNDTWTLVTPRGTVLARNITLATNGYTSHLLPKFTPLIRPMQAQMSALIPPAIGSQTSDASSPNRLEGMQDQKNLIPMSYGFMGIDTMDRVMSDYLIQKPYGNSSLGSLNSGTGGELMYGGGRHLAANRGENTSDDSFADEHVEKYLRTLSLRLNIPELRSASVATNTTTAKTSTTTSTSASNSQSQHSSQPSHSSEEPLDIKASWTGIIGESKDGYPWVGPVPDMPGVFLCAGYSGHGMPNAPLCGRYVARLVLDMIGTRSRIQAEAVAYDKQGRSDAWTGKVPQEYLISRERMTRC